MQTSVLLSIKPEFVELIFTGSKRYEFRRKIFANRNIKRVVVYATSPVGKVVGEFEITAIIESEISELWERTKHFSGIQKVRFDKYFSDLTKGYALEIGKVKKYNYPLELETSFNVKRAPQFFIYLDDSKIQMNTLSHNFFNNDGRVTKCERSREGTSSLPYVKN